MEKLAAMHPQFLRFPGGNYLEGNHISDWYDWKKTDWPAGGPARASESMELLVDAMAWVCSSFSNGAKTCTCIRCWPFMRGIRC